jgi:hypothetical protein
MQLHLHRYLFRATFTLGHLSAGGHELCATLEPKRRDLAGGAPKIDGLTAIPEGTYPIVIAPSGRFHRWLPALVGVPRFKGILIHAGNYPSDTRGCILVGELDPAQPRLLNSCRTLSRLQHLISQVLDRGEKVEIEIS